MGDPIPLPDPYAEPEKPIKRRNRKVDPLNQLFHRDEEERTKMRQELRDLIIRDFQLKHKLSVSEVKELLEEIPELG